MSLKAALYFYFVYEVDFLSSLSTDAKFPGSTFLKEDFLIQPYFVIQTFVNI